MDSSDKSNNTLVPPGVSEDETIALTIVPILPEDSRLIFSDNVAVQHTPSEFIVTFAQVRHPLVTDASEYDSMKNIRADVVARIVMTPAKMVELIKALQENWGMYQRRMKKLMEARANATATTETEQSTTN